MAEPSVRGPTPQKIYLIDNFCIICGFRFVQTVKNNDGTETCLKFSNKKLKLTADRIRLVEKCIGEQMKNDAHDRGICISCFRSAERIEILKKDVESRKAKMVQSYTNTSSHISLSVPSPSRISMIKKRLINSPISVKPLKMQCARAPLGILHVHSPVKLKSFGEVINFGGGLLVQNIPQNIAPKQQPTKRTLFPSSIKKTGNIQNESDENVKEQQQTKRNTLGKENMEECYENEVEIAVFYKSGKKSRFVADPNLKTMCKAIFTEKGATKTILNILKLTNPDEIIEIAASLVADECRKLCKRFSGSILQDRSFEGIFQFSWEKLENELQLRAPKLLYIVSHAVTDKPSTQTYRSHTQMLYTIASALHARSREMTVLQYLTGFILMNGGCTQRLYRSVQLQGIVTCFL